MNEVDALQILRWLSDGRPHSWRSRPRGIGVTRLQRAIEEGLVTAIGRQTTYSITPSGLAALHSLAGDRT